MFRPPTRRHDFSGPPDTTQSPGRFHEAELETDDQPGPIYTSSPSPSTFRAPFEADNNLQYFHYHTVSDYRIQGSDFHGPDHDGKLWESNLHEKSDTVAATTASSSQWLVNHGHRLSAGINPQYPASQIVQPLALSPAARLSYDVPHGAGDALAALQFDFRVPSTDLPSPPNRLTMLALLRTKPKYHAAHQPVPPEKRSSYSELSANLEYLEKLKQEEQDCIHKPPTTQPLTNTIPRPATSTTATTAAANGIRLSPPLKNCKRSKPILPPLDCPSGTPQVSTASAARDHGPPNAGSRDTSAGSSSTAKSLMGRRLACIFCRERKNSCSRPPPGSRDPTCNQCARRSLKCTYIKKPKAPHLSSTRR